MFRLKIHRLVAFLLEGAFPTASRFKPIPKQLLSLSLLSHLMQNIENRTSFNHFQSTIWIIQTSIFYDFSMLQDLSSGNLT
jgi:hypothetical protein